MPHGAWFPLGVGCILYVANLLGAVSRPALTYMACSVALMTFYTWGRGLEDAFDERQRTRLSSIIFRRSAVHFEKKAVAFEPVPDETSAAATSTDASITEEPIELTKTLTTHTPNEIRYAEVNGRHPRQERPTISVDEDLCMS